MRRLFPSHLPAALAVILALVGLLDGVRSHARLLSTFLVTAAALLAWNTLLAASARRARRALTLEVNLRKQHVSQACAQGSVFLYWGWYWRPVYDAAPLIAGAAAVRLRVRHAARLVAARNRTRSASARSR